MTFRENPGSQNLYYGFDIALNRFYLRPVQPRDEGGLADLRRNEHLRVHVQSQLDRKPFLVGVPLVGPEKKVYTVLSDQLLLRDASTVGAWGTDARKRSLATLCSELIREVLGWPDAFFIPDDSFEIVCWDRSAYSVDELRVPSLLASMETLAKTGQMTDGWWSETFKKTYGEVIDRLLAHEQSHS